MTHTSYKCIEAIHFTTAKQFIDFLAPSNSLWGNGTDMEWIFRGQADAEWNMLPRSFRNAGLAILKPIRHKVEELLSNPQIDDLFTKSAIKNNISAHGRYRDIIVQIASELEATKQFLALADELSFKLPITGNIPNAYNFLWHLDDMGFPSLIDDFVFGLAQHHGIPTRYVDWSRKPKIAAYFASAIPDGYTPENIVVWAINLEFLSSREYNHGLRRILCPQETNAFLHKQDGLFLTYADNEAYYLENGNYPAIEDIVEEFFVNSTLTNKPLKKVTLPFAEVDELKDILWRERISLAHLMPTEDNFVSELKALWNRSRHLTLHVTAYGDEFYYLKP